jgi:hypothetical protein
LLIDGPAAGVISSDAKEVGMHGHRHLIAVGLGVLVGVAAISLRGQSPATKSTPGKTSAPRTGWGEPDLQGTWFVTEDVPLERSAANAGKEYLTDEEVAAVDKRKGVDPGRNARSSNATQDVGGAYNAVFNSVLKTSKRTSMIIDPPDGRIPPRVAGAPVVRGFFGGGAAREGGAPRGGRGGPDLRADNPETLAQNPRCLGVSMPFLPLNTLFAQGTVMQIVQSPKSMGIYMEDDHAGGGNRVIFMDGRPHLPAHIKTYLGDSRGHWEGNTLVVETTNFQEGFLGANPDTYKLVEHFRRVDANHLQREITFIDPKTWTRPWTVRIDMGKAEDHRHMIFDSACHEGNFAMTGMLVGARREEQAGKK